MQAEIKRYDKTAEYFFAEGCFITELSNSTLDPDVSIARARVEPGKTTKWHYLEGVTERYVMLEGSGLVEVGDTMSKIVNAGDLVIIPSRTRQRITNIGKTDLVFLAICSPRFNESIYFNV